MDKRHEADSRVVLYSKDICTITGKKYRAARRLYHTILRNFNKKADQFITLEEFCSYTGIRPGLVQGMLKY
jgi:hypothetical protein